MSVRPPHPASLLGCAAACLPQLPACRVARLLQGPSLKFVHWRKSAQWFSLLRSHARVVLEDTAVYRA